MCKPNVQEKRASEPLSIAQFLSAFLLLGIGTALSLIFIIVEHLYMRYLQDHVDKKNAEGGGCFSLFSQSIGQNYAFTEAYNSMQGHRLATSSEEDLDSTYEVKEYEGNIKMQKMSKHQNQAIRSRTDDSTEYKNNPDIQQIEYLDLNSPNNINSSCFSKTSRFSNISPPRYESGDIDNSTYGQKGSNSPPNPHITPPL